MEEDLSTPLSARIILTLKSSFEICTDLHQVYVSSTAEFEILIHMDKFSSQRGRVHKKSMFQEILKTNSS